MAWRRPATETLFIGLAQPQSGVGWVGMGLWPVHVGEPTTSRKPRRGVGNGRASTYVPTGLVCGALPTVDGFRPDFIGTPPIPTKPAPLRGWPGAPQNVSIA
ncbi:MAG: hypothetical protein ACFCUH_06940, partial [Flavobacteriales bacterium]